VLRKVDDAERQPRTAAVARATRVGDGFAVGSIGPRGGRIARVIPADPDNLAPAPDPRSPVKLRAFDSGGRLLSEAGAEVEALEDSPEGAAFAAPVPAGAAAVELVSGQEVLDRLERSHAPHVRVLAPRRAIRIGAGGRLPVRWKATDPDGDDLRVTIDYAADGGTWRTVFPGAESRARDDPGAVPRGRFAGPSQDHGRRRVRPSPRHLHPVPCRWHAAHGADRGARRR
jgi:hypothetical protein